MQMPEPDRSVIVRRQEIAQALGRLVPGGVIAEESDLVAYECDALTAYRQPPLLAVLPRTTAEVAAVLAWCHENRVKMVPRGAGTSLSGGALPLADGILLVMTRFNRILDIDLANRCAVVQPGVTNLAVSQAVAAEGFYFAPDPSSQIACSIGGNVAENAGGVHCLKYGMTGSNILGLEMVLPTGEILRIGGKHLDPEGYDFMALITGSEGLLGVVTEVTVRLLRKPATARALLMGFSSVEEAGAAVAAIIGAGIIPAGLEMMDRDAVRVAEDYVKAGYPLDVEALLICELDGPAAEVDHLIERVSEVVAKHNPLSVRASNSEEERLKFWAGRKSAFPAVGRISPDYLCMDGTIPRRRLPEVLRRTAEMARARNLRVVNVFHAGDGNLHPMILFDANIPGELEQAEALGSDILKLCVEVGGVLTGEHGVGVEKRDLMGTMFSPTDLDRQEQVKRAFDPRELLNPGKVFPTAKGCGESFGLKSPNFANLPRF
jgi:glycolate oxidase